MSKLAKLALNAAIAFGVLLPDLALAMPLAPAAGQAGPSDIVKAGGVLCDFNGCRSYDTRYRRRIYRERPFYDDPYYDDPPVYVRPRVERRVYIRPDPPPQVYQPRSYLSPDHVQWCLDRYRSYNPRTDLYLARRNVFRHCISPYS